MSINFSVIDLLSILKTISRINIGIDVYFL